MGSPTTRISVGVVRQLLQATAGWSLDRDILTQLRLAGANDHRGRLMGREYLARALNLHCAPQSAWKYGVGVTHNDVLLFAMS